MSSFYWLIITLEFSVISRRALTPWANSLPMLLSVGFLFRLSCPIISFSLSFFFFFFFPIDTLLVDSSFLLLRLHFPVMECLKQSQKTWLSEFMGQLWLLFCISTEASLFVTERYTEMLKSWPRPHPHDHIYGRNTWPPLPERTYVMFYAGWSNHRLSSQVCLHFWNYLEAFMFEVDLYRQGWEGWRSFHSVFSQPNLIHNIWT